MNRAHGTQKPHGVSWRNVPGAPQALFQPCTAPQQQLAEPSGPHGRGYPNEENINGIINDGAPVH